VDSDLTDKLQIIFCPFVKYLRKCGGKKEAAHKLYIYFKKAYDSVRREVLCNIVTEFVFP
jgi:hypothetical protein